MSRRTNRLVPSTALDILLERRRLLAITANWVVQDAAVPAEGQPASTSTSDGLANFTVAGLPQGTTIQTAKLSDSAANTWGYGPNQTANGLTVTQNGSGASLYFPPQRDETGSQMILQLTLSDGSQPEADFTGGYADPGRTVANIAPGTLTVPADTGSQNLSTFIADYDQSVGTFILASPKYTLNQPLKLTVPVKIVNATGTSPQLIFSDNGTYGTWNDAVDIDANHVTLEGFSISFSGQIPWNYGEFSGPQEKSDLGVISVDHIATSPFRNITIADMNITAPSEIGAGVSDTQYPKLYKNQFIDFTNQDTDGNPNDGSAYETPVLNPTWGANLGDTWSFSDTHTQLITRNSDTLATTNPLSSRKLLAENSGVGQPIPYIDPSNPNQVISAGVKLSSTFLSVPDDRAGVGLDTAIGGTQDGYNLVFHNVQDSSGVNRIAVQLLWDNHAYFPTNHQVTSPDPVNGHMLTIDPSTNAAWKTDVAYNFLLELEKKITTTTNTTTTTDYLFGKVWQLGTTEPANWTVEYDTDPNPPAAITTWAPPMPYWSIGMDTPGVPSLNSGIGMAASASFTQSYYPNGGVGSIRVASFYEPAINLINASPAPANAQYSGVIDLRVLDNTLVGGPISVRGGPATIAGNTMQGAVAGTFDPSFIIIHVDIEDLNISGNNIIQSAQGGRTVKFVQFHNVSDFSYAYDENISGNDIHGGVGRIPPSQGTLANREPTDVGGDDNASGDVDANPGPEFIDQEDFVSLYVGVPTSVSSDSIVIPTGAGVADPDIFPGDVVSILQGANAGQFYQIRQTVVSTSSIQLFLDRPIPPDPNDPSGFNVSVNPGFVDETIRGNTFDLRGTVSYMLEATGNNYGLKVIGNDFRGDSSSVTIFSYGVVETPRAFDVEAYQPYYANNSTESSTTSYYLPTFGAVVEANTIEDVGQSNIGLFTSNNTATSGLTYFTGTLSDNTWTYSQSYLASVQKPSVYPFVYQFGSPPSDGNAQGQILVAQGNTLTYAANLGTPTPIFNTGTINSQTYSSGLSTASGPLNPGASGSINGVQVVFDGQDGSDFVGLASTPTNTPALPTGVQDLHFTISGLTSTVSEVLVKPVDGVNNAYNNAIYLENPASTPPETSASAAGALLFQASSSTTAELYIPPIRLESGYDAATSKIQPQYEVKVYLDGQASADDFTVNGIFSDQNLPDPPVQRPIAVPYDYDGDKTADFSVYDPSTTAGGSSSITYYSSASGSNTAVTQAIGGPGDLPVAGDFFGDGVTDYAVYVPGGAYQSYFDVIDPRTGQEMKSNPSLTGFNPNDIPVPGDYLGQGKDQFAVYNSLNGIFEVYNPVTSKVIFLRMGNAAPGDIPVPSDYDGDGVTDPAIYDPASGTYYVAYSGTHTLNYSSQTPFPVTPTFNFHAQGVTVPGDSNTLTFSEGDLPVPADYEGTGKAQFAVYRPGTNSTGISMFTASGFYVYNSTTGNASYFQTGNPGDTPIPADYDGDGKTDYAAYRQGTPTNRQGTVTQDEVAFWYSSNTGSANPNELDFTMMSGKQPAITEVASTFDPVTDYADRRTNSRKELYGDLTGGLQVEFATFAPGSDTYKYYNYATNGVTTVAAIPLALPGDIPVPGIYPTEDNGAFAAEAAVYCPGNATYYTADNSAHPVTGGLPGDIPVPGDYFGLGYNQFAVYRPGNDTYYVMQPGNANNPYTFQVQGAQPGDIPVPGDYEGLVNGVHYTNFAVYHPGNETFYVNFLHVSGNGPNWTPTKVPGAMVGDIPVPAHYLPDAKTDYAVYRPAATFGHCLRS